MKTPEQQARDLLERIGVEDAQSFSAGDLVELANLIERVEAAEREIALLRQVVAAPSLTQPRQFFPGTPLITRDPPYEPDPPKKAAP